MVDRVSVPRGIWDDDLNKHPENEYTFEECGYQCSIKRNTLFWTYCGYVTLPDNHPCIQDEIFDAETQINVHGGVTFANNNTFGFDCVHYTDVSPVMPRFAESLTHYWTFEEVRAEVKKMAEQFKKLEQQNLGNNG